MATGYIRQATANIQPNLEINAEDFNTEYDAIASAFDNTTGHDHTGSASGVGAKISLTAAVDGILPIANGGTALSSAGTAGQVPISNGTIFVMGQMATAVDNTGYIYTTNSLVGKMSGFGVTFTMVKSTRVLILTNGALFNDTASDGVNVQLKYGTGTPPAADAATTGTSVGRPAQLGYNANTAPMSVPYTVFGIVTGLLVGTAYWFDFEVKALTGGIATINDVGFLFLEV